MQPREYQLASIINITVRSLMDKLFTIILFSKAFAQARTTNRFKFIAAYVGVAVASFSRHDILVPETVQI